VWYLLCLYCICMNWLKNFCKPTVGNLEITDLPERGRNYYRILGNVAAGALGNPCRRQVLCVLVVAEDTRKLPWTRTTFPWSSVIFTFLSKPTFHSNYTYFDTLSGNSLYSKEFLYAIYFQKCVGEINLPVKWSLCEVEWNSRTLERKISIPDWVLNLNKNVCVAVWLI
jgi:hypothetical protein